MTTGPAACQELLPRRPGIQSSRPPTFFFFFNDTATTEIYTLSLHDALPIRSTGCSFWIRISRLPSSLQASSGLRLPRSEEHTSELQSPCNLVCRLLLEKKKKISYLILNCKKKKKTTK